MQPEESLAPGTFGAPRDEDQNEEGGPHQGLHRVLHKVKIILWNSTLRQLILHIGGNILALLGVLKAGVHAPKPELV